MTSTEEMILEIAASTPETTPAPPANPAAYFPPTTQICGYGYKAACLIEGVYVQTHQSRVENGDHAAALAETIKKAKALLPATRAGGLLYLFVHIDIVQTRFEYNLTLSETCGSLTETGYTPREPRDRSKD